MADLKKTLSFRILWVASAQQGYLGTLAHIANQDKFVAQTLAQRVDKALAALAANPGIGTPMPRGIRRFAIPRTGHTIDYRISNDTVLITRWSRQRRRT